MPVTLPKIIEARLDATTAYLVKNKIPLTQKNGYKHLLTR